MREGWTIRPLASVCEFKPVKAEVRQRLAGDAIVSFAPMEDLGIGKKFLAITSVRTLDSVVGSYTYFADGDVLLAKITPCFENGKLGVARNLVNGVGFGSSEFVVMRPGPQLAAEYLYYFLDREKFREEGAQRMTGAVGHKRVSKDFIENYPIPIPPIDEQHRIVAILDDAFEAIATAKANAEKNLRNAREVFENYHQSIFAKPGLSTRVVKLGDIATFRNGINYTKQSKGQSVLIIGVKDFQNNLWAPMDDLDRVTLDGTLSELDAVAEGDILAVRSNGNPELIGRCMLVGPTSAPATHSGFTIKIRLNTIDAMPSYVCQFLKSLEVRRQMIAGGNGANIKSLNQGTLSAITIPLPSRRDQGEVIEKIEAMADSVARLQDLVACKLASLDELKQSLLHQAFSGQL